MNLLNKIAMSFFDNKEMRRCFTACSQETINNGQCVCLNNRKQMIEPLFSDFNLIKSDESLKFVGLKLEDAIALLKEGETSRVIQENRVYYHKLINFDFNPSRWNFKLNGGIIIGAERG